MIEWGWDGAWLIGLLAYAVAMYVVSCFIVLIRVFLFGNTSERNLQVKQAKFILGNIMSYGSISLLTAIPLWFVMYYLLLVISDYLIDINSVLHGIFGYKTFNFALFLNA